MDLHRFWDGRDYLKLECEPATKRGNGAPVKKFTHSRGGHTWIAEQKLSVSLTKLRVAVKIVACQ